MSDRRRSDDEKGRPSDGRRRNARDGAAGGAGRERPGRPGVPPRRRDPERTTDYRPLEEPRWEDLPNWGGVARRGAAEVDPERRINTRRGDRGRDRAERDEDRVSRDGPETPGDAGFEPEPEPDPQAEEWILESVEVEAHGAVRRGGRGRRGEVGTSGRSGADPVRHVEDVAPRSRIVAIPDRFDSAVSPRRAARMEAELAEAAEAFERERYGDAAGILRQLVREAPGVAEVRELLGLSYYRQGRWRDALRELKVFNELVGSTEQHPVLADCARALGNHGQVEAYWNALRRAAPNADLVAEGRIVMAGSLADRGRLDDAIALMEEAGRHESKEPQQRHLRMAYMLADLNERAGDLPTARSGFAWIERQAPDFGDVADRLRALH